MSDVYITSSVPALFFHASPSAIEGPSFFDAFFAFSARVMAIVVYSVYGFVCSWTHVVKELLKRTPSFANLYASTAMDPRKGDVVQGLPADGDDMMVFHAGTAVRDGAVVTSGGRVLCVTALAENARAARQVAYDAIAGIQFDGMQYRKDIGHRAVRT